MSLQMSNFTSKEFTNQKNTQYSAYLRPGVLKDAYPAFSRNMADDA